MHVLVCAMNVFLINRCVAMEIDGESFIILYYFIDYIKRLLHYAITNNFKISYYLKPVIK